MPFRRIAAGITLVVMLAACSSAAPTGSTPPGGTSAPGASGTPPAATTPPATARATSQQPGLSFTSDPVLMAAFPKQVAGKPVTNLTTAKFVDFITAFGGADASAQAQIDSIRQTLSAIGIDLNTIVFGTATATVNGSSVGIEALRVPGQDANKLIQNYLILSTNNQGDTLSQETISGKNVTVVKSATGLAKTWMYATGDIMWSVSTSHQAEAEAVFAALP
jgi:hypothetical protein